MDLPLVLWFLRLGSAALLLGFLGAMAWLIYQDMRLTSQLLLQQEQVRGYLRVIASESETPALDTCYTLQSVTGIGRSRRNMVVVDNTYTSSEHALVTWRGHQWWLEDLGSRNGTLLNGVPLTETAVVSAGDIITIGGTQFRLEL